MENIEPIVKSKFERNLILILFVVIAILCLVTFETCSKKNEVQENNKNFITALYDSLHQVRNLAGEQVSTIDVLKTTVDDLKAIGNTKDSALNELKKIVTKNTQTATVAKTETKVQGSTKTEVSYIADTSNNNYIVKDRPVYRTTWNDKWDSGGITATSDSIFRNIKIRNDFSFEQKDISNGWFKSKTPVVVMTNKNPNTTTIELRTYTVVVESPKRLIWFFSGVVASVIGYIALHK